MKFPISNFQFPNKNKAKIKIKQILNNIFGIDSRRSFTLNSIGSGNDSWGFRAISILALFLMAIIFIPSENQLGYAMSDEEYNQQTNDLNNQKNETNKSLEGKKSESKTLTSEIQDFDSQINNIQSQINSTQSQIDSVNSQIETTNREITKSEAEIKIKKETLNEYLKVMYEDSNTSIIELIISSNSFSDFVDKTEYNLTMQEKVKVAVTELKNLKKELENKKSALAKKGEEVEKLKSQQIAQRLGVDAKKAAKNQMLQSTKGQEKEYQKQLASIHTQMEEARVAYEEAIKNNNSNDESTYTGGGGGESAGPSKLSWPENGYVTQGYGCTDFADCGNRNGPYRGKPHNGIDMSAGYGASIKAAASGTVLDTGLEYNSQGWGNWVAIRHDGQLNGLVTLYAHLNSINVSPGQAVSRGQQIGTEGYTGFVFPKGPGGSHLHFSVYTNFVLYNVPNYHGPLYEGTTDPYTFLE